MARRLNIALLLSFFSLCSCDEVTKEISLYGIFNDDPNRIYYDLAGVYELTHQLQQTSSEGGGVLSVSPHDIVGHLRLGFNQEVHFKHTGAKRFSGVDYMGTYKVFYGSSPERGTLIMNVTTRSNVERELQFKYNWDDPNITLTEYVFLDYRIMAYYFRRKILPGQ